MNGFFRVFAVVIAIAVAIGIGVAVYNAGVSAGLSEVVREAAASGEAVQVPYGYGYGYGYGPHWGGPFGFGFFGIIFWILGIFLVIGLVRAAFGWGRWSGPGPGGRGGRRDRIEEWHRELHRGEPGEQPQSHAGA